MRRNGPGTKYKQKTEEKRLLLSEKKKTIWRGGKKN